MNLREFLKAILMLILSLLGRCSPAPSNQLTLEGRRLTFQNQPLTFP